MKINNIFEYIHNDCLITNHEKKLRYDVIRSLLKHRRELKITNDVNDVIRNCDAIIDKLTIVLPNHMVNVRLHKILKYQGIHGTSDEDNYEVEPFDSIPSDLIDKGTQIQSHKCMRVYIDPLTFALVFLNTCMSCLATAKLFKLL
jgi:hypothetical protein